jgi:phospholipase/carboxylesterase
MTTTTADSVFIHRIIPAQNAGMSPLLVLHGTGGNENDLLPLAEAMGPGRPMLSPRGRVTENGMPRFFRRFAEGIFDEEDVIFRAHELADFVADKTTVLNWQKPIAIGFSNGANIAAAMLLLRPEVLAGAVLIRAMTPLQKTATDANLSQKPILMLSGSNDPIIPAADSANLAKILEERGAKVTHHILPASHGLTQMDLSIAREFLDNLL